MVRRGRCSPPRVAGYKSASGSTMLGETFDMSSGFGSTCARDDYIDPREMMDRTVVPNSTPVPNRQEIKQSLGGVSYDLLFSHGTPGGEMTNTDISQRFSTVTGTTFRGGQGDQFPSDQTSRVRQRLANIARERREIESYHTTSQVMAKAVVNRAW
jgi:hypothetical protein